MAYVTFLSDNFILGTGIDQRSFEKAAFKGLATDNGLFIPEEIPPLPRNWFQNWRNLSFEDLAFQIFTLYISPAKIPHAALKDIIRRSDATSRVPDLTPTIPLDTDQRIHLLEIISWAYLRI